MLEYTDLILPLFGGSGVIVGSVTTHMLNRKRRPHELNSLIATGSETAVDTLLKTLAAETDRADRAESAVRERDDKIAALEAKIDLLQQALDALRDELHSIKGERE